MTRNPCMRLSLSRVQGVFAPPRIALLLCALTFSQVSSAQNASTLAQERYNMPRIPQRGSGQIATAVAAWSARTDRTSAMALALKDEVMRHWVDAEALRHAVS